MLRASAVALSGAAAGALTTSIASQDAVAAETTLSVTGDEVTVKNGELTAVRLDLTVEWSYEVPSDKNPKTLVVDVLAGTDAEQLTTVASAGSEQLFLSGDGTESFNVDLLANGALDADALVPADGGETLETTVEIGAEMRLLDDSELVIAADSQTDTATLTIERAAYDPAEHGTLTGSGSLTVETESE